MADWERLVIMPLDRGYNRSAPPSMLEPGFSHKVHNMRFAAKRVETDFGLATYGDSVLGAARLVYRFRKKSGVSEIVLITNETAYKWNNGEWQLIKGPQSTTVSGQHTSPDTTILVVDDTGFADGDLVGITMDNGKQHITTVNGTPSANVITITDGVPTGRTFENGAMFLEAPSFSGSMSNPVSADTFPAGDVMIFTNGKDNVQYYDGTSIQTVTNLVSAVGGGNCYADIVRVKDNKVILFNMNENGTAYPQRVRWSATGDYTDWTTTDDAGFEDMYDTEDPIRAACRVGGDMAIYRSNSMYLMQYIGSASLIYSFNRVLDSDGACSGLSVVPYGNTNIIMGKEGFYAYAGGVEFATFGDPIWELVFGNDGLFNTSAADAVMGYYMESIKSYIFNLPTGESDLPNTAVVYNKLSQAWSTRGFGRTILSMTNAQVVLGVSWAEATGDWEDSEWVATQWDDISLQAGDELVLAAGISDDPTPPDGGIAGGEFGQVYRYSQDYTDDDGSDITGEFRTHELFLPEDKIRIDRVAMKAKGSSITLEYSEDEGETWTSYGTATPGSDYDEVSVWKQLVVERVIFRFTGTEFGLSRITIYWRPESRY